MGHTAVSTCLKQKKQSKKALSKVIKLSSRKPLLGLFLDNELSKNTEKIVQDILGGIGYLNIDVVILADSNLKAFDIEGVTILPYSRKNRQALLESADMALGFPFSDVEEMLLHGIIPISPVRPEVMDYDPNRETGNGFTYKSKNSWCVFAAIVRAVETFKFGYDWKHIVRQGLKSVCDK